MATKIKAALIGIREAAEIAGCNYQKYNRIRQMPGHPLPVNHNEYKSFLYRRSDIEAFLGIAGERSVTVAADTLLTVAQPNESTRAGQQFSAPAPRKPAPAAVVEAAPDAPVKRGPGRPRKQQPAHA